MKKLLLSFGMAALALGASAQETVYLFENFEWLEPWTTTEYDKDGTMVVTGDCIGADDPSTEAPQISKKDLLVNDQTAEAALQAKGYDFIRDNVASKKAGECIYLQRNYLRFGKTGYQGGIIFPSLDIPEGTAVNVSFKWCSQRQGSGVIDPTQLVIKVENGEDVKVFEVPTLQSLGWESGHKLEWVTAEIPLTDATVTKDSKISIVNSDDQLKSGKALRWHLDDLKVYAANGGSAVAEIAADENAPVEYFNLQGVRVNNPANGLYIVKQGNKVEKRIIR